MWGFCLIIRVHIIEQNDTKKLNVPPNSFIWPFGARFPGLEGELNEKGDAKGKEDGEMVRGNLGRSQ